MSGIAGTKHIETVKETLLKYSWKWGDDLNHILKFTEDGKVYGNSELRGSWRRLENTMMFEYSGGYIWSLVDVEDKKFRFLGFGGGKWHDISMSVL